MKPVLGTGFTRGCVLRMDELLLSPRLDTSHGQAELRTHHSAHPTRAMMMPRIVTATSTSPMRTPSLATVTGQDSPCQRNSIVATITSSTTSQLLTSGDSLPAAVSASRHGA